MIDIVKFGAARQAVAERSKIQTDINEHLLTLFDFAFFTVYDRLDLFRNDVAVIELGVREGESTKALIAALSVLNASILSIDKEDCTSFDRGQIRNLIDAGMWRQIIGDSRDKKLADSIEDNSKALVFLDTSHTYDDTIIEIGNWQNKLIDGGLFIFHDTNCSWDNKRGVIAAIEKWVGFKIDEKVRFDYDRNGFSVKHFPNNNGLTIVQQYEDSFLADN